MKSFLSQKNLPCILLVVYLIKCLFFPVLIADAIIGIVLSILFGLKLYLDYNEKPDLMTPTLERLAKLEADNAELLKYKAKLDHMEEKISAISMSTIKNVQPNNPTKFVW